jgi:hypothetical protein
MYQDVTLEFPRIYSQSRTTILKQPILARSGHRPEHTTNGNREVLTLTPEEPLFLHDVQRGPLELSQP